MPRRPNPRLKQYAPVIRYEYRSGTPVAHIARQIGVPSVTLWQYIERLDRRGSLQRRPKEPRRRWSRPDRELLRKLWNLDVPAKEIGRHFRRSQRNIQQTVFVRRRRGEQFKRRGRGSKRATRPLHAALAWLRSVQEPVTCIRCGIHLDRANHPDPMTRVPVANHGNLCLWCAQDHRPSPYARNLLHTYRLGGQLGTAAARRQRRSVPKRSLP